MKIKVVMQVQDLDTFQVTDSFSELKSRKEYMAICKKALDSMLEVPSLRITFRILDVEV